MAAIRYNVINGWLPVTVYLMQGETEIANNVHNAFEEGQFTDVLEGEYTLLFVDDVGCSDSINIPTTTTTTTESNEFIIDTLSGYTGFADTYDNGDPDIHGQSFCAHGTISEFSIYCYVNTANLDLRATVYSTVPTHLGATYPPTGYLGQSTNTINTTTLSTDYENPSLVTFYFDDIEVDGEFFIDITYENVVYHHDGTLWIARGPVGSPSYMIYIGDLHFWVKYEYGYLSSRLVGIGDACTTTTTTTIP